MADVSMRIESEEMRGIAGELGRLGGDADQVQGHLQRSWGRLDAGWQSYAKGNVEERYHQAMEELRRMAAMLEQMGRAVHQTADGIEEADQAPVGFFADTGPADGVGPGGWGSGFGGKKGLHSMAPGAMLGGMIAPVATGDEGGGVGEFLERLWNWLNGRGWKTNAELEAETPPPPETKPASEFEVSQEGVEFTAEFEGMELELHNDPADNCSIGVGHLVHTGPCDGGPSETEFLDGITEEQAYELFRSDLGEAEQAVQALVEVPLTQAQYDALVSFTYNVGRGQLVLS